MKAYVIEYRVDEKVDPHFQRALLVSYSRGETMVVPFYEEMHFHGILGEKQDGSLEYFNRCAHHGLPQKRSDYKVLAEREISRDFAKFVTEMPYWSFSLSQTRALVEKLLNSL